jgi:hypothetical protein
MKSMCLKSIEKRMRSCKAAMDQALTKVPRTGKGLYDRFTDSPHKNKSLPEEWPYARKVIVKMKPSISFCATLPSKSHPSQCQEGRERRVREPLLQSK